MAIADRDQLLALDHQYLGLPFVRVTAKPEVDDDAVNYQGLPFLVTAEGGGGPAGPAEQQPKYVLLDQSAPPITADTLVRETGDVVLTDDGFTIIAEDGVLDSGLATLELFQSSTPTGGSWVIDRDYRTNAPSDGVLRSPLPTVSAADESATLTVVVSTTNTRVMFDWGIRGMYFGDPQYSDTLKFTVDGAQKMIAYPADVANDPIDLKVGNFAITLAPGTYALAWRWQRAVGTVSYPDKSHAWIANLIIDPNF